MRVMPNQLVAHRTPAEAWRRACRIVDTYGDKVITEDRKVAKEVRNLVVQILEPGGGWPIHGSGWNMAGLEKYAEQLMDPENPGFDYTYGNRLRAYYSADWIDEYEIDQIKVLIEKLKANPQTRRAIATTWQPGEDNAKQHTPCLQLVDFLFRDGKLHLSATFRSWDVGQAAVPNMYGLWKLLCYVAQEAGMEPGSLTIMAVSAHCYEL